MATGSPPSPTGRLRARNRLRPHHEGYIHARPELSPVLNSDNPVELFEIPEIWLEDRESVEGDSELERPDEDGRAGPDIGRSKSLGAPLARGPANEGVGPTQAATETLLDSPTMMAMKSPTHNDRAWWNALYHQQLVVTSVTARRLSKQFPDLGQRRMHVVKHVFLQQGAFLAFVLLSANDAILKAHSKRRIDGPDAPRDFPYAFSALLLVASLISVVGGSALAYFLEGKEGLKKCWNPRLLLRMSPISFLFQFATILKFVSLKYLPPDMVGLLSQMNLVLMAVCMRLILGKRYSFSQWIALLLTALAMLQYLTIRDARHKGDFNNSFLNVSGNVMEGFLVLIAMCVIETLASVLAEKYFKERRKDRVAEPFYIQKVRVDVSGLLLAALWCYVLEPFYLKDLDWSCKPHRCRQVIDHGLFSGWDQLTWAVLCMVVTKMWLAGIVAKVLDTVVKQLGSCAAMVLTYVEVAWFFPEKNTVDFETAVSLSVVAMAIASFAVSTRDSEKIQMLSMSKPPSAHHKHDDWAGNYAKFRHASP